MVVWVVKKFLNFKESEHSSLYSCKFTIEPYTELFQPSAPSTFGIKKFWF